MPNSAFPRRSGRGSRRAGSGPPPRRPRAPSAGAPSRATSSATSSPVHRVEGVVVGHDPHAVRRARGLAARAGRAARRSAGVASLRDAQRLLRRASPRARRARSAATRSAQGPTRANSSSRPRVGGTAQEPDRVVGGEVGQARARRRAGTDARRRAGPRGAPRGRAALGEERRRARRRPRSRRPRPSCLRAVLDELLRHRRRRSSRRAPAPPPGTACDRPRRSARSTRPRCRPGRASAAGCRRSSDARDELRVAVDVGADLEHRDAPVAAGQRQQLRASASSFGWITERQRRPLRPKTRRIFSENGDAS